MSSYYNFFIRSLCGFGDFIQKKLFPMAPLRLFILYSVWFKRKIIILHLRNITFFLRITCNFPGFFPFFLNIPLPGQSYFLWSKYYDMTFFFFFLFEIVFKDFRGGVIVRARIQKQNKKIQLFYYIVWHYRNNFIKESNDSEQKNVFVPIILLYS